MKGKYINTVIMMAARSKKTTAAPAAQEETVAIINQHKLIWSKPLNKPKAMAAYRSITAMIY